MNAGVSQRSRLRGAWRRPAIVRRRPIWRWVSAAVFGAVVVAVIWAVRGGALPDAVRLPLYWAHDRVYLPLAALIWTRAGFWSLIWVLPALALAALALPEWLGVAAPVRRLQSWLLRRLMRARSGRALLRLVARDRRAGDSFTLTVLRGTIAEERTRIRDALLSDAPVMASQLDRLERLALLLTDLAPEGDDVLLTALDALALARAAMPDRPAGPLAGRLTQALPDNATTGATRGGLRGAGVRRLATDGWARARLPDGWVEEATALLLASGAELEAAALPREAAAAWGLRLLIAARLADPDGGTRADLALSWLSAWRRNRTRLALAGGEGDALFGAEGLADVELWAAWIEGHRPPAGSRDPLIAPFLGASRARDHGEVFAATGLVPAEPAA